MALKHGVGELLLCTRRRHVPLLEASQKLKLRTEPLGELAGVVSFDREAAAPLGTPKGKRRNNDMPSDPKSPSNRIQVRLPVSLFCQEVKHSPVVPHIDLLRQA